MTTTAPKHKHAQLMKLFNNDQIQCHWRKNDEGNISISRNPSLNDPTTTNHVGSTKQNHHRAAKEDNQWNMHHIPNPRSLSKEVMS